MFGVGVRGFLFLRWVRQRQATPTASGCGSLADGSEWVGRLYPLEFVTCVFAFEIIHVFVLACVLLLF